MNIPALLASIEALGLPTGIRNSLYLFPLIEAVHVVGLTMVFGTILVIDLRLLGRASTHRPFTVVAADVLRWTWAAFALAATTGGLMFMTNAASYYYNPYFRAKMALLVLAGVNMLGFELTARRSVHLWDRDAAAPLIGRVVATVSLILWLGVIVMGRWVGFTLTSTTDPGGAQIDLNGLEDLIPK